MLINIKIPLHKSNYKIVKTLYKTQRTRVHLIQINNYEPYLVLKKYSISEVDPAIVESEHRILFSADHKNIIKVYGTWSSTNSYNILMEYASRGDMFDFIYVNKVSFDIQSILALFFSIGKAIEYLHEHDIVHHDIKPENIGIKSNGEPVLIDFGFAYEMNPTNTKHLPNKNRFTPQYAAPEILNKQPDINGKKVDVWCFGLLMFETLTRIQPNTLKTNKRKYMSYVKPKILRKIISYCLKHDPNDRPEISDLVKTFQFLSCHLELFEKDYQS